jgi:hypothetical protein
MRTALAIVLLLTGSVLAQNTIGHSRTAKRYDRNQLGTFSVMPTSLFTNCVMWLPFSAKDGTNYYDFALTNNGTSSSAYMTNLVGGCISLVASNSQYINMGNTGNMTSDFTIAFWLKPVALGVVSFPFSKQLAGVYDGSWNIRILANNAFRFAVNNQPTGGANLETGAIITTNWQQFAFTFVKSSGAYRFYYNGAWTAGGSNNIVISNTTYNLLIGCQNSLANFFNGNLDGIQLFNRALTSNEVVNLNRATKGDYGL